VVTRDEAIARLSAPILIHEIFRTIRTIARLLCVFGCVYVSRDFLSALAGKETILAVKLAFLGDIKFAAAVSVAGMASVWAAAERWLRHRDVEKMQGRIRDFELRDKNRTTSGLTPKGKTNPRDRT
jgi:hypothetical protein